MQQHLIVVKWDKDPTLYKKSMRFSNSENPVFYIIFPEAYSEPCQTSKIELFSKIIKGF